MLGHDSDWWNFWMLVSLGLVALAALAAVVTTTGVVRSQKKEADASARELERYKSDAAGRIAEAQGKAATAIENAGHANEEAARLRKQAEDERTARQALESDLNAEKKRLGDSEQKRLDLAISLLPRDFFDQSEAMVMMSEAPPMSIVFEFGDDRESRILAEEIYSVFPTWKGSRRPVDETLMEPGIIIAPGGVIPKGPLIDGQANVVRAAADILLDTLSRSKIDARIVEGFSPNLPITSLLVRIGPKPNHVLEETLHDLAHEPSSFGGWKIGRNRRKLPDPTKQ